MRHLHQRKKRIPSDQVARLLNQISIALDYAHKQGVVHRDIKSGNIMLHNKTDDIPLDRPLTDDIEPVITDFGLVRIMNATTQTASGTVSGTPAYMSPEQARGDPTDHRTDIYSLGVVLYEMLAGRVPFEADSTLTVLHMQIHTAPPPIPGIALKVQQVIDHALAKNPDERYQDSRELAMDYFRAIGMTAEAPTGATPAPNPPITQAVDSSVPTMQEPTARPEPASRPDREAAPRVEPTVKPEPIPKRARSTLWIGVGFISLVVIALLAFGAYRLFAAGPAAPNPTEITNVPIANTDVSPSPSDTPALPEATGMVHIEAGTYDVGRDPADDYHNAPQSIALNEFWIDQYQVTNADYERFIAETGAPPPMVWPAEAKHPVRGVSWEQASAYCAWVNKRLANEAEWEAAGRGPGPEPQLHPWGDDPTDGGNVLQLPNDNTYEVGSQFFNVSPFQVYDMVGNVWEWVGEPYGNISPGIKILRGGRYSNPVDLAYRLPVAPDDTSYIRYAGFRCAANQVR
jgi:serine/threonine-protein kinase